MKNIYKTLVLALFTSLIYTSCDLEENPPFLAEDNVYSSVDGANAALNGIYTSMANFNYYSADFHHTTLYMSGLVVPKKTSDRTTIGELSPLVSQNYPTNLWRRVYQTIARANDMIANVPTDTENDELNNILGIAYFLRAHSYLHLVRMYGGVPLHTKPATSETLHQPRASVADVYALIIADGEKAESLMFESNSSAGRPGKYAANMLLAKAHMTMAGNDSGSSHWQLAFNEASKVYGNYSLVPNYGNLWATEALANNNEESIFEIQFNVENSSAMIRLFTPGNAFPGRGWERFKANPEVIDAHMDTYPDDPRIDFTFISEYQKPTGQTIKAYPSSARNNFNKGYPWIYKYFIKDQTAAVDASNFNYVHYRYADLLLMLAEIENELGMSAQAHAHVNEVLTRARNTGGGTAEPANWSGLSQDEFRTAIMKEYTFELFAEGQDFFNGRRRGYDFFKTNYIDVHNARNDKPFDIVYPDNSKAMLLPIPSVEIETNQEISTSDQNPGY